MVNRDLVALKLAELEDRVARIERHVPESPEGLRRDRDALDLVAFNLMLAVQACADIAAHVIADEKLPVARNLVDAFTRLRDHGVLSEATATALGKAVGLRNVVAHGYAGVEVKLVHQSATMGVADLSRFAQEVARHAGLGIVD